MTKTTADPPLVLDTTTISVVPTPPINLHDIEAVRRELARVYRDMRAARIETQDGTRLVYALTQIAKLHEAIDLVRRLDKLEELTYGT